MHYVTNEGSHGQKLHLLIFRHGAVAGIIGGGGSAYDVAARNSFLGITKENHLLTLNGCVDNTVFRLFNPERNLATMVLVMWRKAVPVLWQALYDAPVYAFETFVFPIHHHRHSGQQWPRRCAFFGSSPVLAQVSVDHV